MNIIGKIFGLIFIALIILVIVNFRTILPYFDNLVTGGKDTLSPVQIGANYVDQVNKIYSVNNFQSTSYSNFNSNIIGYSGKNNTNQAKVTVEKTNNIISVITEYLSIPTELQGVVHIWLSNTPVVSDQTTYMDLGVVKNGGIQTYTRDIGSVIFSLQEFKYILIINPQDFTIYSQSSLQI